MTTGNYFNQYYRDLWNYIAAREQRGKKLEAKVSDLKQKGQASPFAEGRLREEHAIKESTYLRLRRTRLRIQEFQILSLLGCGGYGEVFLAKKKGDGEAVALKRIKKALLLSKNEVDSLTSFLVL